VTEAALVDLDGTVYRGDRLLPGADDGIARLRTAGIDPVFLSNNATRRPADYRAKLAGFGIEAPADRVVNSAGITAEFLAAEHPGARVYVAGEAPLVAELEAAGVPVTAAPERTDAVLLSLYRSFDYATLEDVLAADRANEPPVFATNPDRTCPVDGGEIPDCGALVGAVEGLLDRPIDRVLGKPSRVTVDVALARAGAAPEDCLMIGDRLETDIRMGAEAGMETVLVTTGVTDRADVAGAAVTPDHVIDSLADVGTVIE